MATAAAAATDWGGWAGAPPVGPPMADVATRVFKLAPFWVYASAWHMERYSAQPSISFSSAIRGDDMLRLYRDRQLKGSNLIVGLTQVIVGLTQVPALAPLAPAGAVAPAPLPPVRPCVCVCVCVFVCVMIGWVVRQQSSQCNQAHPRSYLTLRLLHNDWLG